MARFYKEIIIDAVNGYRLLFIAAYHQGKLRKGNFGFERIFAVTGFVLIFPEKELLMSFSW